MPPPSIPTLSHSARERTERADAAGETMEIDALLPPRQVGAFGEPDVVGATARAQLPVDECGAPTGFDSVDSR